jgi:hypothetical protein
VVHETVLEALNEVLEFQRLRKASADLSAWQDDAVRALLDALSPEGDVAEQLWKVIPADADVTVVADLLSLWTWRTDDNGSAIMRTTERWVADLDDPRRIEAALQMDGLPFRDAAERKRRLQLVQERYPYLAGLCRPIIEYTESRGE